MDFTISEAIAFPNKPIVFEGWSEERSPLPLFKLRNADLNSVSLVSSKGQPLEEVAETIGDN
ncbi:MAG: hypothetical protein SVX43_04700 [Cyanobacteriota bacterium]|nr:hypothetical protein [Cyanobacteriota bacterium]